MNNYNTFINYNEVLSELKDFILDDSNIQNILSKKIRSINNLQNTKPKFDVIKNKNKSKNEKTDFIFIPKEKDSLFWCFYIMKNGEHSYNMIDYKNLIVEKKIKIEYIERIRKEKQLLKTYKFSTLTNIENNLLNQDKLDINTFLTLCVIENFNILFIKNKCYFELLMNDTSDLHIIYLLENDKYGFETTSIMNADTKKTNLFKLDNIEKPIKSISSYKVKELTDICIKLGIETINKNTSKNKSKKDLYEAIIQFF